MASTSWCRSGGAVAWCRFGGGGLFGPDLQNDAGDGQGQGQGQPDDGPRRVTAAMAQCLAIEDSPEDDRAKTATALPDATAGARTPVLRAGCWGASIKECSRTWAATKNATG
jgi:hypothetical protein